MKIDKHLNIVFPIERENGKIYVHSTPISRQVFEQYYLVLAKTLAAIFEHGVSTISGPKIAAMLLKTIATTLGAWEGPGGVKQGFFGEIRRISNIVLPDPKNGGWHTLPLQEARRQKLLDDDELAEVEGVIVFFICVSAVAPRTQARPILELMVQTWGAQITQLNSTEYGRSLPISTEAEILEPPVGASVPY